MSRTMHRIVDRIPQLFVLLVLWFALWGHVDLVTAITGVAFSVLVITVFSLPSVERPDRFHLGYALAFLAEFAWHILRASFQVAWFAVRRRRVGVASIIAAPVRCHGDLALTLIAEANMLVPGSVVVDADRARGVLYLHIIDADDDAKVDRARRDSERIEERIALAIGRRDDIVAINRDREVQGRPPLLRTRRQIAYERDARARLEAIAAATEEHDESEAGEGR